MKTYKEFREFCARPVYFTKDDLIRAGFKKWQLLVYSKWANRVFYKRKIKEIIKKITKGFFDAACGIAVCLGLVLFSYQVVRYMRAATVRNELQALESVVYICRSAPKLCEMAKVELR